MNFLAHLHLSQNNKDVMVGNFMADSIKGKQYLTYPTGIKHGILLHRFIDDFTDRHPTCLTSKILLRPTFHKLSPILIDMIYDHFLALYWNDFHPVPLRKFVDDAYALLSSRSEELALPAQHMLPYMIKYDWLYNYQFKDGMQRVLSGMSKRVRKGEVLAKGWEAIEANREVFKAHFFIFYPEIVQQSAIKLKSLQTADL